MKKLTREQILAMQRELIAEFGGSDGLRDEGLFESALAAPYQTFDGYEIKFNNHTFLPCVTQNLKSKIVSIC